MHRFTYLKLGLAVVLGFVGLKMLLLDLVHIPIAISLGVIAACLAVALGASLRVPQDRAAPHQAEEHPRARVSARHLSESGRRPRDRPSDPQVMDQAVFSS
jgi:hypothetical protein